ncbi:MAG: hypothetical protein DWP97_12425, partial [Calditrichaeota bacterium]
MTKPTNLFNKGKQKLKKHVILLTMISLVALLVIGCSTSNDVFAPDSRLSFAPVVVPAGATIQTVTFNIYVSTPNNQVINLHRITSDWDEATVTHNSFGGAYDAAVAGSFTADNFFWHSVDITSLFLSWADGTYPNHGILLDQEGIDYPMAVYHSRELTTNHAYLEVCYELNGEIICEETEVIGDATINESRPDDNFGSIPVLYTGWLNSSELEK